MSVPVVNYTWSEYVAAVTAMLTVDADRAGISAYRLAMIRQGTIHLQQLFDGYRKGHETLYQPNDLVTEGRASRGVKPPQSVIRDVFLVRTWTGTDGKPRCVRYPMLAGDWRDRFALVNGKQAVNGGRGTILIDPYGYEFVVYPEVFDCWTLSVFWDGLKLEFRDNEETPFDEPMAGAVAAWTKAHIAREVDQNDDRFRSYMQSFQMAKPKLYVAEREKSQAQSAGPGGSLAPRVPCGAWAGNDGSVTWSGPDAACSSDNGATGVQQVFTFDGDPNGHVPPSAEQYTTLPLVCIDTLNQQTWSKTDGLATNTGWV